MGTDGSATATRAVDRAVDVARTLGSSLTILSAGKPGKVEKVLDREVQRLAEAGVSIETRAVDGDAVEALVTEAEQGSYDLLVVGNKGMTGLTRFLGSVPNKVSHHITTSLLIVRTT